MRRIKLFLFGNPWEYGLLQRIGYEIAYFMCARFGHQYESNEEVYTPDTGYESYCCVRCQHEWGVTYY